MTEQWTYGERKGTFTNGPATRIMGMYLTVSDVLELHTGFHEGTFRVARIVPSMFSGSRDVYLVNVVTGEVEVMEMLGSQRFDLVA